MANRYNRQAVLASLRELVLSKCNEVYFNNRETVKTSSICFVVIRLPQGIDPDSNIHNTAVVQFQLFAKDVNNGVEGIARMENLVDGISSLFPFNNGLISCNDTPLMLDSKSDGMGYHSIIMQFKIVIKFNL